MNMKKLKAFSLVEMLITLGIMTIVIMLASQTLVTLLRVSTATRFKVITRNESDFGMDLVEKLLANSNVSDVRIFQTKDDRTYNEEDGVMEDSPQIEDFYQLTLQEGVKGNEIHIRPYGYELWVCIGYFKSSHNDVDENVGYLLRRTVPSLSGNHEECFGDVEPTSQYPLLILNSEDVNVNNFMVSYIRSLSYNNIFHIDMEMEPNVWLPSDKSQIEKSVYRQSVITTKGLTWY